MTVSKMTTCDINNCDYYKYETRQNKYINCFRSMMRYIKLKKLRNTLIALNFYIHYTLTQNTF